MVFSLAENWRIQNQQRTTNEKGSSFRAIEVEEWFGCFEKRGVLVFLLLLLKTDGVVSTNSEKCKSEGWDKEEEGEKRVEVEVGALWRGEYVKSKEGWSLWRITGVQIEEDETEEPEEEGKVEVC